MWDEEDGFFYDVLRLPDGQAAAAQGALDGRPAAAVRGHRVRRASCWRSIPELARAAPAVPRRAPGADAPFIHDPGKPGVAGRRLAVDPRRDQAPPRAGEDARRERVPQPVRHPLALALPRRASLRRSTSAARSTACRYLPAESDTRHVRRQLELARPDLDAGQRPDHPRAAAVLHATTATTSRSNARPAPGGR